MFFGTSVQVNLQLYSHCHICFSIFAVAYIFKAMFISMPFKIALQLVTLERNVVRLKCVHLFVSTKQLVGDPKLFDLQYWARFGHTSFSVDVLSMLLILRTVKMKFVVLQFQTVVHLFVD